MDYIVLTLAAIGFIALFAIAMIFLSIMCEKADDYIDQKKKEHKYKHRFDKPPTAECYCIDCVWYTENIACSKHGFFVADDYFCYNAKPDHMRGEKKDG